MGALGYVMQVPEEEKYLNSKEELENMIVSALGGRAAEEIVFGNVTTGAANDIEKATSIAKNMITRFGMSERFGLAGFATVESQYLEGRTSLNCSDQTAAAIDEEVVKMLKKAYDKAKEMLRGDRELMDKLAAYLIEKETITGKEFMQIFRKEKGIPEPAEEEKKPASGESSEKAEEKDADSGNSADEAGSSEKKDDAGEETEDGDVTAEDAAKGIDELTPDGGPDIGIFSNHSI
jgi:cell division protease FtsH